MDYQVFIFVRRCRALCGWYELFGVLEDLEWAVSAAQVEYDVLSMLWCPLFTICFTLYRSPWSTLYNCGLFLAAAMVFRVAAAKNCLRRLVAMFRRG